jgi:hypothetical protein
MKLWSDFYDLLLPDAPGCPLVAAGFAVRQSAIAFCEQSLAWRYVHPDIAVLAGTAEYAFIPLTGAAVHTIIYAELDGKQIRSDVGEGDIKINDWRNTPGVPEYVLSGSTSMRLVPEPNASHTLKLIVALKPTFDATGIDDEIFAEYREAIIHGALAKLMLSPKKPYSNPTLAQFHQQQSVIKTGQAGIKVARNFTRAPLQTAIMRRDGR